MKHLTRRTGTARFVVATLMAATALAPGSAGAALVLYHFYGTVSDPIGRALSGARVTDGSKTVTADSAGAYRLGEDSTGSFRLTAYRTDTSRESKIVQVVLPTDTEVNFTLYYRLSATISKQYLSTASAGISATLTITTYAPNPGLSAEGGGKSCVYVTDSRTGVTSSAALTSGASSPWVWTWTLDLPQNSTEGVYTLTSRAADCSSGTALTYSSSFPYVIDNIPPVLHLLAPADRSNTQFMSQRLVAYAEDFRGDLTTWGSGMDPASLSATVAGGGGTQTLTVTLSGTSARSSPAGLAPGLYEATMTARDKAGNQSKTTGRFRAMSASGSTGVTLPPTPYTSKQEGNLTEDDLYVWENVTVGIAPFTVTLDETFHSGGGVAYVDIVPNLQGKVTYDLPLLGAQATTPLESDRRSKTFGLVANGTGKLLLDLPSSQFNAGRVTALVDKGASNVRLSVDVQVSVRFPTCPDPTVATEPCTTDPLAANDRRDLWEPWANLLNIDPYSLPAAVGSLRGLQLAENRCTGTSPTLSDAIIRLGNALNRPDFLNPNVVLNQSASETLARIVDCIATHVLLLPAYDPATQGMPADSLRSEWLAAMRDVLSTTTSPPANLDLPSGCVDALCLVQTGGRATDTYTADAVLALDEGGDDTYNNNVGGAVPLANDASEIPIPVALVLDLGQGDDRYWPLISDPCNGEVRIEDPRRRIQVPINCTSSRPTNGSAARGGVGMLVDGGGNDHYCGLGLTMGAVLRGGGGLLLDQGGNDSYVSYPPTATATETSCPVSVQRLPGQSQKVDHGAAEYGGFGFLVDLAGDDTYLQHGVDSIGHGALEGVGLVRDDSGDDTYRVHPAESGDIGGSAIGLVSGVSIGTGEAGGIGVVLDGSGTDYYTCTGELAYGCGGTSILGELGLLYDRGTGGDTFDIPPAHASYESGTLPAAIFPGGLGSGTLGGKGVFVSDDAPADSYTSKVCRSGGYGFGGTGIFLDLGGFDGYGFICQPWLFPPRDNNKVWVGEGSATGATGYGIDAEAY